MPASFSEPFQPPVSGIHNLMQCFTIDYFLFCILAPDDRESNYSSEECNEAAINGGEKEKNIQTKNQEVPVRAFSSW